MNLIFPNNSDLTQLLIGGKAYNLAKLTQKGFPVPEWFVLTTEVFDQLIHSIDEDIKLTLKNFKIQEAPIVSDEIKHLIMGLKFPNNFPTLLHTWFRISWGHPFWMSKLRMRLPLFERLHLFWIKILHIDPIRSCTFPMFLQFL